MKRADRERRWLRRGPPETSAVPGVSVDRQLVSTREKGLEWQPLHDDPSGALDRELAPGTMVAGKLRVVRKLGAGGMGAVYEVEHVYTKHRRALKLLHPRYAEQQTTVQRFLREASAAGHIQNRHIVETFDAGQLESGEPYLVMELLEGQPLDELLRSKGRLAVGDAVELLRQAAEGVQAAHDAGIVHRDLKPENLFVLSGAEPFVKVLDFGISKFDAALDSGRALTREGSLLGTPYYMAPEQLVQRKEVTVASDVYALGVIAYECVTGLRPFDAQSLPELSVLVHEGKCTPLGELGPDLPAGYVRAVERAISRDPGARQPSARAFADALVASLAVGRELESADTVNDAPAPPPRATAAAQSAAPPRPASLPPARGKRVPIALLLITAGSIAVTGAWWSAQRAEDHGPIDGEPSSEPSLSAPPGEPVVAPTPSVRPPDAAASSERPPRSALPAAPPKTTASSPRRSESEQLGRDNPY